MNTVKGIFSKKSDEWRTPLELFNHWNEICNFTLDAASTDDNALCEKHYTKETDGLSQTWKGERVWCNPPYSEVQRWVDKAIEECQNPSSKTFVVMLLPSRTDTKWFQEIYGTHAHILFLRGRLRFNGCNQNAPFPSIIAVFGYYAMMEYRKEQL